jgi:cytosine/adenosine deaminase-related metal-dependent hydrolase
VRARRLAGRWVLPIDGPPIEHGAVLLGADGRIGAVGPATAVPAPAGVPTEDFGDAALLPGLINTHTHLELTGLGGQTPDPEFAAWIRRLRETKSARTFDAFLDAARRGLADCWAAGVTTIADTGDSGSVAQALAEAGGSGIVYHEVFGPHPDQRDVSLQELQRQVERLRRFAGGRVRLGVSPHAPYTVSGPLYAATAAWARAEELPVAVHVAESLAESRLLAAGEGSFAEAWLARGIPMPSPAGRTPIEWLDEHGVLTERTLCIHVVQATAMDIDRLARVGAAIAHCPLSNAAHGHGVAPLAGFLTAGLRVGLGTDSVASVGALDLLAEARAAQALADLDAVRCLALCTLEGARALALDREIGSLTPGKWGDLVVIGLGGGGDADAGAVAARLLASGPRDVRATFVGGRDVYRSSRPL